MVGSDFSSLMEQKVDGIGSKAGKVKARAFGVGEAVAGEVVIDLFLCWPEVDKTSVVFEDVVKHAFVPPRSVVRQHLVKPNSYVLVVWRQGKAYDRDPQVIATTSTYTPPEAQDWFSVDKLDMRRGKNERGVETTVMVVVVGNVFD